MKTVEIQEKVYGIEVVDRASGDVAHTVPCNSRNYHRVERGININMNHARFFTRVKRSERTVTVQAPKDQP